jgi:cytoplasmic tRNA 2-thiolation protein 1
VFRRQALDRGAARLGIRHVVTGHNADDVAETVMIFSSEVIELTVVGVKDDLLFVSVLERLTALDIRSKDLEKIRPSSILDIVKSGEDMAALVPVEVRGAGKSKQHGMPLANRYIQ